MSHKIKALLGKGSVMATVPNTTGIAVGARVSGLGIVPGTTVAEIRGPQAVQLSQGATDTVIDAELVFDAVVEQVPDALLTFDEMDRLAADLPTPKRAAPKVAAKPVAKKAAPKPVAKKPVARRAVTTPTRKKK